MTTSTPAHANTPRDESPDGATPALTEGLLPANVEVFAEHAPTAEDFAHLPPLEMPVTEAARDDAKLSSMLRTHGLTGSLDLESLVRASMTTEQIEEERREIAVRIGAGEEIDVADLETSVAAEIAEARARPDARAAIDIVKRRAAQQIALAQRVQAALGSDVLVELLAHDQFQQTALAAVDGLNVVRHAALTLARMMNVSTFEKNPEALSLNGILRLMRLAAAHLHTAQNQQMLGQQTLDELRRQHQGEVRRNNEREALLQARLANASQRLAAIARVPVDMPQTWLITAAGAERRYLCRVEASEDSTRLRISDLEWSASSYRRALKFKTRAAADGFIDRIFASLASRPGADETNANLHGVNVTDVSVGSLAIVEV